MKKIFSIFFVICLCITFLTSCSLKPTNADALWEKMNQAMEKLDSYESNGIGKLSFELMDVEITADLTIKNIFSGANTENFYHYSSSDTKYTLEAGGDSLETPENTKALRAFHNGKMFFYSENGTETQKFYSSLTAEEYAVYLEKQNADDIDFSDCTETSFSHNKDKTWTLNYSGYSNKNLTKIIESFGLDSEVFDFDIDDVEISILADEKFRVKEIKIQCIFDEEYIGKEPVFEITTQYYNYNNAQLITDTLNSADYKEIPDCRLLTEFDDMIKKLEKDQDGSFVMTLEQTLDFMGQEQTYTETDTVAYGEKDGQYFYDITASTTSSSNMKISYTNGTQTIQQANGQSTTKNQSTTEAKAFINNLINTAKYSSLYVSDMEELEDGVYKIYYRTPDADTYKALLESYNGSHIAIQQNLKITVKDGNIVKIESNLYANATSKYSSSYPDPDMHIHLHSTATFNP